MIGMVLMMMLISEGMDQHFEFLVTSLQMGLDVAEEIQFPLSLVALVGLIVLLLTLLHYIYHHNSPLLSPSNIIITPPTIHLSTSALTYYSAKKEITATLTLLHLHLDLVHQVPLHAQLSQVLVVASSFVHTPDSFTTSLTAR